MGQYAPVIERFDNHPVWYRIRRQSNGGVRMTDRFAVTRRAFLASVAVAAPAVAFGQAGGKALYRDRHAPIEERVRDLLGRMTLEEKVAQMRCLWMTKTKLCDKDAFSPTKAQPFLADGIGQIAQPGDSIGTSSYPKQDFRAPEQAITFVNAVQRHLVQNTRLGIPALFNEETAHGLKAQGATIFPNPLALGSTWDTGLVEQAFSVAAREARLRGATVALSPVLDLARDPRFGRVEEFFGEDPYLVARMGIASVHGQQGRIRPLGRDKVYVTLKHFVHGVPQNGLNLAPSDVSERTMREIFLVPFEQVIRKADPAIIMPSYNEVQGVPAHASIELLQHTGRERLGFKGAYFSDFGGVAMLAGEHKVAANNDEAAILAVTAGVDSEMPDGETYANLPDLVRAGRVPVSRIDESVARILALKFEAGLFENPYIDPMKGIRDVNTAADIQLARKVAQKAIVLLKNDGLLPLDPNAAIKLAVIGPNAVEPLFGGYSGENAKAVGVLAGIKAAAGKRMTVEHAEGVRIINRATSGVTAIRPIRPVDPAENAARIAEAVKLAERSDVIMLALGDAPEITREAISIAVPGDRRTLGLYGDQDALVEAMIATGKPIVALLVNGRPLTVNRLAEKANALVEGWYMGQEGGNAFADVLFGKVNPGGKLTVTFPAAVGDLPVYYNQHPSAKLRRYVEGRREPLFPFGHGLSYTQFEMSEPRLAKAQIGVGDSVAVEVDVTNIGTREGDEVVQLYLRDEVSSVPRPVLELCGFERVTLKAKEKRTVRFTLDDEALAFWNIDMKRVVEPGTFKIHAGPSSAKLKAAKLTVV